MSSFCRVKSKYLYFSLLSLSLILATTALNLSAALAEPAAVPSNLSAISNGAFNNLWSRNDLPVKQGAVSRTWTWGPESFKLGMEPYADAPGGTRAVAYWDKSRMEINNPFGDTSSQWYVTNGLLVREMVSGNIQVGDNAYQPSTPSIVPVAGDPNDQGQNPNAPTYSSFAPVASLNNDHRANNLNGQTVTTLIDLNGKVTNNVAYGNFGVKNAYYDSTLGHNIPNVFINFFNSSGQVWDNGTYRAQALYNWVFAAGLPITEPYWATVKVAGKDTPVLIQLFERRVLTYNPANSAEWRVEMGNVGRHYYAWRYGNTTPAPTATLAPTPTAAPVAAITFVNFNTASTGEKVLEIGNNAVKRTVVFGPQGGAYTSSILNRLTNQEYMGKPGLEFRLDLNRELAGEQVNGQIDSDHFHATAFDITVQNQNESQARITFSGDFDGHQIHLYLYYDALAGQNFIKKWLTLEPFAAGGWAITNVVLESWEPDNSLSPLSPVNRFTDTFANGAPNYQESQTNGRIDTENPTTRYVKSEESSAVALHNNGHEGFYFFEESLFGAEKFNTQSGLELSNTDFVEPYQGFTSGKSVIGMWQGAPEIGFKRYSEYIYNYYAEVKGKPSPVWFSTWYPYESGISEQLLLDTVDRMQAAGFYDLLHIDAGWQGGVPLQPDPSRFPDGLDPIVNKLKANGKSLGLWINPFSRSYESLEGYGDFANQNPNWVDQNDPKQRFCPLSGMGDYVRNRLLQIARSYPLDELYWDGADWNIANCRSADQRWRTYGEEYHEMIKYYAGILQELHAIRPNLRVNVWSAPGNIHWLSVVDEIQLSDVDELPLMDSELYRNQQMYQATFQLPYSGIWVDWYGINYHRNWQDGLGQSLDNIKYAYMRVVGNGATQAGGALDLTITPTAVTQFLSTYYNWRKQFSNYFTVYQHVLGFPNGTSVDGEAHIINGQGFILLFNPSQNSQTVDLPLTEPELELTSGVYYNINNWTDLTTGAALGRARPGDKVTLAVPARGYLVIGINV